MSKRSYVAGFPHDPRYRYIKAGVRNSRSPFCKHSRQIEPGRHNHAKTSNVGERNGQYQPISASCSLSSAAPSSNCDILAAISLEASFGSVVFFCLPFFAAFAAADWWVAPASWWWWLWLPFVYADSGWVWFEGIEEALEGAGTDV